MESMVDWLIERAETFFGMFNSLYPTKWKEVGLHKNEFTIVTTNSGKYRVTIELIEQPMASKMQEGSKESSQ